MFSYRLFDFLDAKVFNAPNEIALAHREKGLWIKTTFQEYKFKANCISKALLDLGVKKGDKIGSVSPNRSEWNFLDMAILQIGAVHVALHPSYSTADILYILNQTELNYFFCGNRILYKLLLPHLKDLPFLKGIYCFDDGENINSWNTILPNLISEKDEREINERKDLVKPDDVAIILYTSGTGGNPKGAIHTHTTFGTFAQYLTDNYYLKENDIALSVLSISHAFERLHYYFYLKQGLSVYFADSNTLFTQQINEIKPNSIVCVPLIIESFYKAITEKYNADKNPDAIAAIAYTRQFNYKDKMAFFATEMYKKYESYYKEWNKELGGSLKQIITGAAMIPEYLVQFFWCIQIPLFECYGSTEALLHTINHENFKYKTGTVGFSLDFAEVKISDEDEIWMKSKSTMKGYYKLGKLTKAVIDADGWYHTGDTGFIDEDGFLHIEGRANTIFKMMNGKYLNPELIEQQLCAYHLIKNMFIAQDKNMDLIAVVRPNSTVFISEEEKQDIIQYIHKNYNSKVMQSERIEKLVFTMDNWSIETEEYTPTLKLKRKILLNKYLPLFQNAISIK